MTLNVRIPRALERLLWVAVAVPGLYQLGLLAYTVARRFPFPYDLEWMEGGMLNHALRLSEGHTIYPPPSIDFIPYLYTPGYPALLAALGKIFGLTYQLGRAISLLSIVGVVAVTAVVLLREQQDRLRAFSATALAGGVFAATYPWVEGWFDLVRGDTLFLAAGAAALAALLARLARLDRRSTFWRPDLAALGALLALTFFIKQTGVLLVATGGALVLTLAWRAVPAYVLAAGLVGGGGCLILDKITSGWFWIYVFKVHQQHDTNAARFWRSFANIFLHFPALTAVLVVALVLGIWTRQRAVLAWIWIASCGAVIGALGWATQWAHFNAYIPALTFMGMAAAVAIGVFPRAGLPLALALAVQLVWPSARWKPAPFIPATADRVAGDALIARLREIPGDVLVLSHPWYAHLAGKPTFAHRMNIMDVTYQGAGKTPLPPRARDVAGLEPGLRSGRWDAVILDDRYEPGDVPGLTVGYTPDELLEPRLSPRVVSGARSRPRTLWIPASTPLPAGTRRLFDFEKSYAEDGWTAIGDAWGPRPELGGPGHQMYGYHGRSYASSWPRREPGTGTLLSPPFTVAGRALTLRLGGGSKKTTRVELRDAASGEVLRTATGPNSLSMSRTRWDVADLRGRSVRLILIDEEKGAWGAIWLDDVREEGLP